jgi:hypothetical protein
VDINNPTPTPGPGPTPTLAKENWICPGTICDWNSEADIFVRIEQGGQTNLVSFAEGWVTPTPRP